MNDFDYEELDRAVSSVANPSAPPIPAPAPTPDTSVAVSVSSSPAPVATPADTPAVRRSSSGRFMDVVHPSSDMRNRPTERSDFQVAERPSQEEPVAPVHADMPDPIDFSGFSAPEETDVPATDKPLESPFLSDAKVEKVPLGAMPPVGAVESAPEIQPETAPETIFEQPQEELLEAPDEKLLEATTESSQEVAVAASTPEYQQETSEPVEETPASTPFTQQPSEPKAPSESGAIYDTDTYHQPIVHQAKKASGALVVLWIALLVIVGAGAGAAVYFFVLQ